MGVSVLSRDGVGLQVALVDILFNCSSCVRGYVLGGHLKSVSHLLFWPRTGSCKPFIDYTEPVRQAVPYLLKLEYISPAFWLDGDGKAYRVQKKFKAPESATQRAAQLSVNRVNNGAPTLSSAQFDVFGKLYLQLPPLGIL